MQVSDWLKTRTRPAVKREPEEDWAVSAGCDDTAPLVAPPALSVTTKQPSNVYFEDEAGQLPAAKLLSKDEARRIAVNIAKLSELFEAPSGVACAMMRGGLPEFGIRLSTFCLY